MKNYIFYATLLMFLFSSCEKEALEPEVNHISPLEMNLEAKAHQSKSFKAHLTGDQEVPPVETLATGQAIFRLSKDGSELYYKLIVANLDNVTMAHIHLAPAGDTGGVVVWLYPDGPPPQLIEGTTNGILAEGVITGEDLVGSLEGQDLAALLEEMNDGNAYVNIHTSQVGSGEIRGQISANGR